MRRLRRPDPQNSQVPLDDLPADPESQTGAFLALGGKEWLEDFGEALRRYPRTRIGDGQDHASSSRRPIDTFAAANQKTAAFSIHRIDGIAYEIAKHLPYLAVEACDFTARTIAPLQAYVRVEKTALIEQ